MKLSILKQDLKPVEQTNRRDVCFTYIFVLTLNTDMHIQVVPFFLCDYLMTEHRMQK